MTHRSLWDRAVARLLPVLALIASALGGVEGPVEAPGRAAISAWAAISQADGSEAPGRLEADPAPDLFAEPAADAGAAGPAAPPLLPLRGTGAATANVPRGSGPGFPPAHHFLARGPPRA